MKVAIVYEPDEGGWHVYAPALKGLHSFGVTKDDARQNVIEAIELWLEMAAEQGQTIPDSELVEVHAA